jgi:hypothetical protein
LRAVFQSQEGVSLGLKVMNEVHQVVMMLQNGMACELLGTLIRILSRRLGYGRSFGKAFDGHVLSSQGVLGKEDHPE